LVFGPRELLIQGFSQVFPRFLAFRAYQASYLLIGMREDGPVPPFQLERLTEEVRQVYGRFGIGDLEAYLAQLRSVAEEETSGLVEQIQVAPEPVVHSSDRPILEYLGMGGSMFQVPDEVW
jgi:hypothetical protein